MLEIRDLEAGYEGKAVLHGIDLTIPAGRITVITGPNGCGKSTLLKTIAGILPAAGGKADLDGMQLLAMNPRERARQVALLSQSRQIPEITVQRLVLHGRFPYLSYPRRYRREDMQIAQRAMETMGIGDLAQRRLVTLSGGQRQKAYLAMLLAQDTPVVLMDEPTTYLDVAHQMQMIRHARFLADNGKTVVLVLHDLAMALKCADQLVVMQDGRIWTRGEPETIADCGVLEEVFGVRVERMLTPDGWQYYYKEKRTDRGLFSDVC